MSESTTRIYRVTGMTCGHWHVRVATRSCSLEDQDRWTIPNWTRSAVRQPRCSSTSSSRSRGPAQPARVHQARHDHRAVDGVDHRRHRGLRWHRRPAPRAERPGGRVPAPVARPRPPAARSGSPSRSRPARSTRSPCRTSAATASSPSASSSCARSATDRTSRPGWPSRGSRTRTAASGRSSSARASSGRTARDFTSADVAATMDRLVEAGNAGLKGVIDKGGAVATDPNTVAFTLVGANGNFPYLVSVFNAQSLITPAAYATGHDARRRSRTAPAPGSSSSYDRRPGAEFDRNDDWWGGQTPLDGTELIFFDDTGPDGHRLPGRPGRRHRPVPGHRRARRCSTTRTSTSSTPRRRHHRQIWMRCDTGQFADKRVRQALALTFDRPALIQQLFKGQAEIGNDHVIGPFYPFFDAAVPQRAQDIDEGQAAAGRRPGSPT